MQGNTNHTITLLFALYSLIVANNKIIAELQQPIEQALQQFESMASQQKTLEREQEQLIKAIRQQLHPVALTQPTSQQLAQKRQMSEPAVRCSQTALAAHQTGCGRSA